MKLNVLKTPLKICSLFFFKDNLENHDQSNSSRRTLSHHYLHNQDSNYWNPRVVLENLESIGYNIPSSAVQLPSRNHETNSRPATKTDNENLDQIDHVQQPISERSKVSFTIRDMFSNSDLMAQQSLSSYSNEPVEDKGDFLGVHYDDSYVHKQKPSYINDFQTRRNRLKNKQGGVIGLLERPQDIYSVDNYGPMWNGGGSGFGHGGGGGNGFGLGGGLSDVTGLIAAKKTVGAKALFVLMVPLILLAVFGPILAGQAMIPWAINGGGGMAAVTTVASGKRRKRRSLRDYIYSTGVTRLDPRQVAELEKRLKMFMAVQEYIAESGNQYTFTDQMATAFLKCQGYLHDSSYCLERMACESTDKNSGMNSLERRISGL